MYPAVVPLPEFGLYWNCAICGTIVNSVVLEYLQGKFRYEPESKYWHSAKKVVYCSPICSTTGHSK